MHIIPAILAKTEAELRDKLAAVPRAAEWVHMDFVAPAALTLTPSVRGEADWRETLGVLRGGSVFLEAHLMLPDPRSHLDDLVRAGFSRVIVQVEDITSPASLRSAPSSRRELTNSSLEGGARRAEDVSPETFADLLHEWRAAVEIAPSLAIETPLSVIDSFAHELKSVQLMGIAEIGAQGRPFDTRAVERVRALHTKYPHLTISVDGGVNKKNSERLISAGAGRLVVGSRLADFYSNIPRLPSGDTPFKGGIWGNNSPLEGSAPSTARGRDVEICTNQK